MPLDYAKYPNLRKIQVSIPTELVSVVDVATPTHRSRSAVVAEALQEWLERRGIESPGEYRGRWTVSGSPGSEPGF
jgi:metal-responsive CopG/Arc/MetJ family transcriptional regulator